MKFRQKIRNYKKLLKNKFIIKDRNYLNIKNYIDKIFKQLKIDFKALLK